MKATARIVRAIAATKTALVNLARGASTSQKLTLAFALFLAPLALVASKLADEQQNNVDTAVAERQGAAYVRVVNEASALVQMQMRAHQLGREDIDDVSPAIRALQQAEARYGAALDTAALNAHAVSALRVMLASQRARATASQAAAAALSDLAQQIGDHSRLMRDPERASHYAADVALARAPALALQARGLAAAAFDAFKDRRLSESERAEMLQGLTLMQGSADALNQAVEAILESTADPRVDAALGRPTNNALANFADYRNHLERTIESGRFDADQLIAREAGAQFVLADLSARVSSELDRMLEARIEQLSGERTSTLFGAGMLFLAVLGSVVALLRLGLVQPIDSLSKSIRALADGCYEADIPALQRGDEIGDIARALAILRDAAQARIAADAARAAAESANAAKSQFVAAMSHELRTPLNAIIGYAEILMEDAADRADASAESDLNRIVMAARHLLAVINDILDLSKMEAGRMDVLAAPCDPAAIALEAIATANPLASKNQNALETAIADVHTAYVDGQKLRQCLLNLLSNACKFTKNGTVSMSMALEERAGDAQLVFTVRDSGIGISAEQMQRLFKPFTQANGAITRQYGGTGLGLMITRRMAQLMGGEVNVESAAGEGAVFTLWVPQFYKGFGRKGATDVSDREGAADAPLVVVIDDEASARDLVARTLTPIGFAVQSARTAEAGLALVRSARPSLVLLDINLPDRAGWSLISDFALDPATATVPVIVLSIEEDRRRSLELGAADHLVKPASRELLCATALRLARTRPGDDAQGAEIVRLSA